MRREPHALQPEFVFLLDHQLVHQLLLDAETTVSQGICCHLHFLHRQVSLDSRHDALHELIEQRHRESCIAVVGAPDHSFCDQAGSQWTQ